MGNLLFENLLDLYKERAIFERQGRKAPKGYLNPHWSHHIGIFQILLPIIVPEGFYADHSPIIKKPLLPLSPF